MWWKIFNEVTYIFLGLTIIGINKTPKTKINNGAIITKNDSIVIKSQISFIIFYKFIKKQMINK